MPKSPAPSDDGSRVRRVFDTLLEEYGPQHWWPAESGFEVAVGAVLTQNTAWRNVEKAIARLKREGRLDLDWLADSAPESIAPLIRSSGFFNVKARRLHSLCVSLRDHGGLDGMRRLGVVEARGTLLEVNGVGDETADSVLLYALGLPVPVVDAYARRILSRIGVVREDMPYAEIGATMDARAPRDQEEARRFHNEFHALLVEHGKRVCRKVPRCADCPLRRVCDHGRRNGSEESTPRQAARARTKRPSRRRYRPEASRTSAPRRRPRSK